MILWNNRANTSKPPTTALQGRGLRRAQPGLFFTFSLMWLDFTKLGKDKVETWGIGKEKSRKGDNGGNQSPPWLFQG